LGGSEDTVAYLKSRLGIDPLTGEELERTVAGLFKTAPTTVARLREVLK